MNPIRTSVELSAGAVVFEWDLPDERGDPIYAYTIQIKDNDGDWNTTSYCDGTDSLIVSSLTCTIPMNVFRDDPFNLPFNTLIEVRGFAINLLGTSTASNVNTVGARVRTIPNDMTTPFLVSRTNT